jgi:hypothetical protein
MRGDHNGIPYEQQWREYRRLQRLALGLWLGWIPFGAVVFALTSSFRPEILTVGLLSAWMAVFVIAGMREGNFRCPRCGRKFFSKKWYHNGWASRCLHCQLPKWAGSPGHPLR